MRTSIALLLLAAGCNSGSGSGSDGGTDGGNCGPRVLRPQARSRVDGVLVGSTVYLYGGDTAAGSTAVPAPRQLVDDFWTYDVACDAWKQLGTQQPAGPIGDYAAAYDSKRNRIIYYGGQKGAARQPPVVGELWAFDIGAMTWAQLAPTGAGPGARVGHRMTYDAAKDRLVLFGGDRGTAFSQILRDTWQLSFAASADGAWNTINGTAPPARRDPAAALETGGARWMLFGGAASFSSYANDVWAFTLATDQWAQVTTSGTIPSARFGSKMDVGPMGQLVLFGGHDPLSLGVLNDTYGLDPTSGAFTQLVAGDTSTSVGGADLNSPERRERHALLALPGRIWVYGGKSDCGPMDDAWALAFTDTTKWTPVFKAMIDETCPRRAMPGQMCQPPPNDCTNPF